ncbi:MAG: CocE/NonD family hydrolase [Nevskia sp.]|nr:CocE/NonD family hydrolase [Nevskia sp.]
MASGTTTTLGTRGSLSQANAPLTSNAGAAWHNYSRPAEYPGVAQLPLQFITLKSGKKLGVMVALPGDAKGKPVAGTFPVILMQTAYRADVGNLLGYVLPIGNDEFIGGRDQFLIRRGYASVTVDVYGTGTSDGEWQVLGPVEQEAYNEAIDWAAQQPWSNGKVGVAGTSYLGLTAVLASEQLNPAVKASFAIAVGVDPYRDVIATGGLFNASFISLWLGLTQWLTMGNELEEAQYPQYARQLQAATQEHGPGAINDMLLPMVHNVLGGVSGSPAGSATDDGDFWVSRSPGEQAATIPVPTLLISGSHDLWQRGAPLLYEQMKRNVNTKLIVEPGEHAEAISASILDADSTASGGAPSSVTLLLQWFDQYLKGMNTGADTMPNVTQFVSGYGADGGGFRFTRSTDWPNPAIAPTRYYLHGDLSVDTRLPKAGEATHTVEEPKTPPVVSIAASKGGNYLMAMVVPNDGSGCSLNMSEALLGAPGFLAGLMPCLAEDNTVEKTQHALLYETAPLTEDLYFNGPIEADVWMSSTATQAALSLRLDNVLPNGDAVPIDSALMSAAFRAVDTTRSRYIDGVMVQPWHPFTAASAQPLVPNQPVLVPIEVFPTAVLLRKGDRLRIAISASNRAEGIWDTPMQALANGGVDTIYNDPDHPSSIVLPVLPTSTLN